MDEGQVKYVCYFTRVALNFVLPIGSHRKQGGDETKATAYVSRANYREVVNGSMWSPEGFGKMMELNWHEY